MVINYNGDNMEDLRVALAALKPNHVIRAEKLEGMARFDMVWPDGQVSEGRWFIREGDSLDTVTGATYAGRDPVDDADLGIGIPVLEDAEA